MQKVERMTQAKYDELKAQLDELKTVRSDEVAEQIKIARGYGDLSENAEYDEAKNEQGKLYSQIAELEYILANAEIIEEPVGASDEVKYGSHIVVRFEDDDEPEEYTIVGTREVNLKENKISDESPVGKAVMHHRAGETVTVEAPAGHYKCTILSVTR
ncbi:MAG: transcription elongation factor GreA [Clostridia bacterium]|nr:transcription elongation factor GreA [Clostridia bacterium]